jgi:hypothetical protein
MAHHYHVQVDELYAALQEDLRRSGWSLRRDPSSLVREIISTPEDNELKIDARRSAGIPTHLPSGPPEGRANRKLRWLRDWLHQNFCVIPVEVAAGKLIELRTRKKPPIGAADVR